MVCMLAFGGLSIADDLAEDSGRRLTLPPADAVLDEECAVEGVKHVGRSEAASLERSIKVLANLLGRPE